MLRRAGSAAAPAGGGAPEAEPLPAGRPGGHTGTFCSPGPERGTDGAGKAVWRARERPQREKRVPGESLSVTAGEHREQTRARRRKVTGGPAAAAAGTTRAPLFPVKVNLAREGRAGRRVARHGRASLPSQCHRCLSPSSGGHGGVGIWPGVRAINCDRTTLPTDAAKPPGFSSSHLAVPVPSPCVDPMPALLWAKNEKAASSAVTPAAFWG